MFARILVDVDLSEKMFETVVIESEGQDLSIQVQYEKHPSFCAHCRMLGHNTQNCLKLNPHNLQHAPAMSNKKYPNICNVNQKQTQASRSGKHSQQFIEVPITKAARKMAFNSNTHTATNPQQIVPTFETVDSHLNAENINKTSLNQSFTHEVVNEDETVRPVLQRGGGASCHIDFTQCF